MASERKPSARKRLEHAADLGLVRRRLDRAVGAHALANLLDARVEQLRQHDLLGKDVGPRLVADAQRIAKAARDEERRPLALALEQRVGGDGRAHLHRADFLRRDRRARRDAEQPADRLDRGVAIGLGILREQLRRMQPRRPDRAPRRR